MAEQVNGILEDEFYLDQTFAKIAYAKGAAKNASNLYSKVRLHLSCRLQNTKYGILKKSLNQI